MTGRPGTCAFCGGEKKRAYWASYARTVVISRCLTCGANFLGAGAWLPQVALTRNIAGNLLEVDPHTEHLHGHGPCGNGSTTQNEALFVK